MHQNPQSNTVREDKLTLFKSSSQYRILDRIDDEQMEFEWNIFPRFTTLQLCNKVQEFMSKMSDQPEEFQGRSICVSMFNDISWGSEDKEQECESNANLVSIHAKRFSPRRWSFLGPGSEKKWYSTHDSRPQGEWDRVAEFCDDKIWRMRTLSFPSHESIVPRNAQKQRKWKIINTLLCWWRNEWNCFSHNYFC